MISKEQLAPIVHRWVNLSLAIKQDPEADSKWGWVQEMYAWSIASTQIDGEVPVYNLKKEFMLQPPWDASLSAENGKKAYIIHYTYGNDFNEGGEFTPGKVGSWHWDKRDYSVSSKGREGEGEGEPGGGRMVSCQSSAYCTHAPLFFLHSRLLTTGQVSAWGLPPAAAGVHQ